jgi:class 3 adenylate cyclase
MADLPLPEPPQRPDRGGPDRTQRASDADRDRTVTLLREHVVDGRLTLDEFSERVGRALAAVNRGDLDECMTDLPSSTSTSTSATASATATSAPAPVLASDADAPTARAGRRRRWHVAVLSGHSTKGRWRISGKTNAVAVMGGCDMDLRRAELEGSEISITAFAFWGGVNIVVPEGFEVDLRGFAFMGGRDLRLRDVPRVPGSPVIVVRAIAVMGGIEVKSRPNRSARQLQRASRKGRRDAGSPEPLAPAAPVPPPASASAPEPAFDRSAVGPDVARDGTVTILFCDMVDYAGMTERLGDQASLRVLREHHRIVREALAHHGGREVKVQGDGFMVAFGGVARALRCAIDIQRAFDRYVAPPGGEPITVHIGVHTGDAVDQGDDYLGHTVIVASRLADVAGPREILVSSLSEQLVQGSGEFHFDAHEDCALKGMTRPQPSATLSWAP